MIFCYFGHSNPRPCPVLDVTGPGDPHPGLMAPDDDLRTDLPKYRVYKDGKLIDEPSDITKYWLDDLVAFLLGCSAGIDRALQAANIHYRILGAYTTIIRRTPALRFHGPMTVTGRLLKSTHDAIRTIQISSRYPLMHGPPIHFGNPATIGITDLYHSDIGLLKPIAPKERDEITLFWDCGVTPQLVALEAKLLLMIIH